jgi:toxin ParE1/3/4
MTAAARKIQEEIRGLPLEDMLALNEHLLLSIHEKEENEDLDLKFRNEIQRRVDEIHSGKAAGFDAFEALKGMWMALPARVVKLHPDARVELQESVAFYRERAGERWAQRFKLRVAEGFGAVLANPERYSTIRELPRVRRIRLKQFPFSLLYIEQDAQIWVVAVAHASRKPGYWKDRIS